MISVIIPVYNVEKYIEECLKSVVNQDYPDIQIICVNDGSTDSSRIILENISKQYNNVEVYDKKNEGLSAARNYGLKYAKGEYIYFLDSDDILASHKSISFMVNHMDKDKLDVLCFDGESFFESDSIRKINYRYLNYYSRPHNYGLYESGLELFEVLYNDGQYRENMALKCIRKDLIEKSNLRFIDGMIYEDVYFSFALALYSKRVKHVKEMIYRRRVRSNSITQKSISFFNVYSLLKEYIGILELLKISRLESKSFLNKYINELSNRIVELTCQLNETEKENIETLGIFEKKVLDSIINTNDKLDYVFPYHLFNKNSRVLLYGAGKIGKALFKIAKCDSYVDIVGIADKRAESISSNEFPVLSIDDIKNKKSDFVLICVDKKEIAIEIKNELMEHGFDESVIVWDSCGYRREKYIRKQQFVNEVSQKKTNNKKLMYLLMLPEHGNLGDYLIGYSVYDFLIYNFKDYNLIALTTDECNFLSREMQLFIGKEDILVFNGGGYVGDIWNSSKVLKEIIKAYPDNKKIIMPNTLTYRSYNIKQISDDMVNLFKDEKTFICFRDEKSYNLCVGLGLADKCILAPDMALYFSVKDRDYSEKTHKFLLCIRDDEESSFKYRDELKHLLIDNAIDFEEYNINKEKYISQQDGHNELEKALKYISQYRMVITDRLHVMIICYLTKTPCIAFDNSTNKISEVYKWIESSGIRFFSELKKDSIIESYNQEINISSIDFTADFNSLVEFINNAIGI